MDVPLVGYCMARNVRRRCKKWTVISGSVFLFFFSFFSSLSSVAHEYMISMSLTLIER